MNEPAWPHLVEYMYRAVTLIDGPHLLSFCDACHLNKREVHKRACLEVARDLERAGVDRAWNRARGIAQNAQRYARSSGAVDPIVESHSPPLYVPGIASEPPESWWDDREEIIVVPSVRAKLQAWLELSAWNGFA